MKSGLLHFVPAVLILVTLINLASADPPVTPKDKAALRRFRPEVENFLPHDWMKEDSYLLRWIRNKKYDLVGAKEALQKNIEWRKENDMDNLQYSSRSAFAKDFPIRLPGVDKEGRAVVITDWSGDMRKYVLAGKRNELSRHIVSSWEIVDRKVRELNVYKNSSHYIGIHDLHNLVSRTHLCIGCLPVFLSVAAAQELYYPLASKEYIVINTPRIFHTIILPALVPVLGNTLDRVTFFGNDKEEWKGYLLKQINADQLPTKYGGTQQS